jgi:hypothetical protein
MGKEVRWSYVLNDLSLTVPSKVWLDTMTVTQDVDGAASAAAAVPGRQAASWSRRRHHDLYRPRLQHNDVRCLAGCARQAEGPDAALLHQLVKQPIGREDAVTFSSQATVTEDALSKRWTQKAGS